MPSITVGQIVDGDGGKVHSIQFYGKWVGAVSLGAFVVICSAIIAAKLTLNVNKPSTSV